MNNNKILEGKYAINSLVDDTIWGGLYLATNIKTNKTVLINFLDCDLDSCKQNLYFDQFFVAHPNNPQESLKNYPGVFITNIGATSDKQVYLILEKVEQPSLIEIIKTNGRFLPHQAITMGLQLCNLFLRLNSLGIIYRYINPETIMIDLGKDCLETKALDIDININKLYTSQQLATFNNVLELETQQFIKPLLEENFICICGITLSSIEIVCPHCGHKPVSSATLLTTKKISLTKASVDFLSPEELQGMHFVYPQSEIYTFGILLYLMLSGGVPFDGKTVALRIAQCIQQTPCSLISIFPDIPKELDDLVACTLAKKAQDRYKSFVDLTTGLKSLLNKVS